MSPDDKPLSEYMKEARCRRIYHEEVLKAKEAELRAAGKLGPLKPEPRFASIDALYKK